VSQLNQTDFLEKVKHPQVSDSHERLRDTYYKYNDENNENNTNHDASNTTEIFWATRRLG
jgi:hypothetical protein